MIGYDKGMITCILLQKYNCRFYLFSELVSNVALVDFMVLTFVLSTQLSVLGVDIFLCRLYSHALNESFSVPQNTYVTENSFHQRRQDEQNRHTSTKELAGHFKVFFKAKLKLQVMTSILSTITVSWPQVAHCQIQYIRVQSSSQKATKYYGIFLKPQ